MTNILAHLAESTLFAAAAWILTLFLRRNRAAVRYWIWFVATCKFLVPFSVLIALGNQFPWRTAPIEHGAPIHQTIEPVAPVLSTPAVPIRASGHSEETNLAPDIAIGLWLCGCFVGVFSWIRQWRRARAVVRSSTQRGRFHGIGVLSSRSRIEPGVFGILRPVLLLPRGIENRLAPGQIAAILSHELCHVGRRDNLTAAIHMLVETIFWFHPAVWLIRAKLAEERERACDEAVLAASVEPEVYAEGILNVCRFYLEPRLACVSGVSGSNLKKRIEVIMSDQVSCNLNFAKRILLAGTAVLAAAGPIIFGVLTAPPLRAQSPALSFEAASVKPSPPDDRRLFFDYEPGRFRVENLPLTSLIALAYDVPISSDRISGGPAWVRKDGFEIVANAAIPPGTSVKAREGMMRLMLRSLLAERFNLTLHHEMKEMPVYELTVAKNGPKLKKASVAEKDCPNEGPSRCHVINGGMGRGLHAVAADISDIVFFVGYWADRPVIDKTRLQGLYELDTEGWTPMRPRVPRPDGQQSAEDTAFSDPARPTLFMILDRLGLKMESRKGPVETFQIEHVDRPSPN